MTKAINLMGLGVSSGVAHAIGDSGYDVGVAATGTTQNAAYAIKSTITEVTTATGGANDSVRLPIISLPIVKEPWIVKNNSAATIKVFPGTGDAIDNGSANAAVNITTGAAKSFYVKSATGWTSI